MPISGLLVTLPHDDTVRARAERHIAAEPRLSVGQREGLRMAVVAETDVPAEDEALLDALQRFDGLFVDVVFYDFSDVESVDGLPRRRRRRPLHDPRSAPQGEGG